LFESLSGMNLTDLLGKVKLIGDKSPKPEAADTDTGSAKAKKAAQ
jgi:hypothetical protein